MKDKQVIQRDANLRRSKIWRLSILHYTLYTKVVCLNTHPRPPPPPPTNWPSHHCLGHYLKIYMSYMLWKGRNNLCQPWLNRCRNECPRNCTINKKVSNLRKNTKAVESSKAHFIREILWPEQESGRDSAVSRRPPNNRQDLAHMRSVTYS